MSYEVYCLDNFHIPSDSSKNYTWGRYETYEEAFKVAKYIVDLCLMESYGPGMTGEELYSRFMMFGDTPMIMGPGGDRGFAGEVYARQRAIEICTAGFECRGGVLT